MESLASLRLAVVAFRRRALQKIDGYWYFPQGQEITDFCLDGDQLLYL